MTPRPKAQSRRRRRSQGNSNPTFEKGSLPRSSVSIGVLRPSTAIYPLHVHDLPLNSIVVQSTAANTCLRNITYGTGASNHSATISNFYREWRVLGARIEITPLGISGLSSNAISGNLFFAIDEDNVAAPTSTTNLSGTTHIVFNVNDTTSKKKEIQWIAVDLDDLTFVPTTSSITAFYIKVAGSAADTGLAVAGASTPLALLSGTIRVQTRGYFWA